MANSVLELKLTRPDVIETAHRFRNLAEDLFRDIELTGLGAVPDIDTLTKTIRVIVKDKSRTAQVRHIIKRHVDQHYFTADIETTWHR